MESERESERKERLGTLFYLKVRSLNNDSSNMNVIHITVLTTDIN